MMRCECGIVLVLFCEKPPRDRATLTTNVIYVYITAISFSMFLGLEYTVIHVRIYILSATL